MIWVEGKLRYEVEHDDEQLWRGRVGRGCLLAIHLCQAELCDRLAATTSLHPISSNERSRLISGCVLFLNSCE